jgi:sulfate transport system ATP-binding protein
VHVTTVFVTHDQEEAMDVADEIVVLAGGVVVQVGSPDEMYDNPANPFVMSFLGPVTRLAGHLVRPHDIEVSATERPGSTAATVTRVVRLGFEVRVETTVDGQDVWAQLTRGSADHLNLAPGDTVHLRPVSDARTLAAEQSRPE